MCCKHLMNTQLGYRYPVQCRISLFTYIHTQAINWTATGLPASPLLTRAAFDGHSRQAGGPNMAKISTKNQHLKQIDAQQIQEELLSTWKQQQRTGAVGWQLVVKDS